ncbi:type IX secretion system membrane protein PorP/SprF [Pontibacter sp. KCTC 32443]|uniref:PorP/SprF family type IX secretion system membrane protein n=1 Tax=Pontibacter TaxID=323449 RepID=UPI00164CE107|nr:MULTISPECIES: type IX secretion system membrane protein PorP/SprF [Pontibacter]MBC5775748.1 type IX secretion system membrane protein PorP/SprF [Pontibacter sp. KCTC 32443]
MMRGAFLTIVLWAIGMVAVAQQLPHFSQYMLNGYLLNPAMAGVENYGDVKIGYRNQWSGVEGAPKSYYATVHAPLNKLNFNKSASSVPYRGKNSSKEMHKNYRSRSLVTPQAHHGLGFTALTDKAGALKRSDVSLTYAYHLPLSRTTMMSVGLTGGFSFYSVDQSGLYLTNPTDPTFMGGDYYRAKPNISAGAMVYTKKYYVGATTTQILQDELSKEEGISEQDRAYMHYYVTGGYKVVVSPKLSLLPSMMVKYVPPAPVSVDANLKVLYQDKVWIGGSYRHKDAAVVLAGINVSNLLQVGYAYDIANSDIGRVSDGSHEIVLGLLLNNRGKVFCPASM